MTILSKEPASPRKLNPRLPAGLEGVIVKALKKNEAHVTNLLQTCCTI